MHQLFLVSSCYYLQREIREVMATAPVPVVYTETVAENYNASGYLSLKG